MISSKREVVPAYDNIENRMSFTYGFRVTGELPVYCSDREWYVTESLERGKNRKWTVTDVATGCTVGRYGRTRQEAIYNTCDLLLRVDRETLLAKVKRALAKERRASRKHAVAALVAGAGV